MTTASIVTVICALVIFLSGFLVGRKTDAAVTARIKSLEDDVDQLFLTLREKEQAVVSNVKTAATDIGAGVSKIA